MISGQSGQEGSFFENRAPMKKKLSQALPRVLNFYIDAKIWKMSWGSKMFGVKQNLGSNKCWDKNSGGQNYWGSNFCGGPQQNGVLVLKESEDPIGRMWYCINSYPLPFFFLTCQVSQNKAIFRPGILQYASTSWFKIIEFPQFSLWFDSPTVTKYCLLNV